MVLKRSAYAPPIRHRFSEEIIKREAGIIEGLNAVDVTGSPAKGSISGYPSPTKAGGEKKVEWGGDVGGEKGSSGKLAKFSVFVLAVGGLLYPEELASLFGGVVGVEGVKLLGAFVLGISVWNVIGRGESGSGTKGMHAPNIKSPTKRGSIDDGSEVRRA